jgi:DNA-binding GntR family transcriptional regulator
MTDNLADVIDRLEEDIVFGRRRPRERLVEDELVNQIGAKKHVVRQALAELERMGLVERKRNRGAMVRDYRPDDARQIFAVRTLLEGEAARLIPLPAPDEVVSALRVVQAEHSAAVEAGEIARAFRANVRFHQTLFQACGNPYLADTINDYAFKSHGIRSYSAGSPPLLRNARDEHLRMIEALQEGRREELVALCVGHLHPPLRAYIEAYEQLFGVIALQQA